MSEAVEARRKGPTARLLHADQWWISPAAVLVFILCWELAPRLELVNERFTSRPTLIAEAFATAYGSKIFWYDALVSFQEFGLGFGMALLVGIPLGFLMGSSRFAREFLMTPLMALYVTPSMVLLPMIILWFGIGLTSRAAVGFLAAIFPIIINIIAGMEQADKRLLNIARVFGATGLKLFVHIHVPATLPFLLAGVRLAIGRAILTVVAAEMFVSQAGMGFKITLFGDSLRIDQLLVYALTVSLFGYSCTRAIMLFEERISSWKETL